MTNEELKTCPCGKTPQELFITDGNQGGKYALVYGDCCGEWQIEFRTDYHPIDSHECKKNAMSAWNYARRVSQPQEAIPQELTQEVSKQVIPQDHVHRFIRYIWTLGQKE